MQYILQGTSFNNLEGFCQSMYDLMEREEDWVPSYSLDAFNDALYGAFGGREVLLIWLDSKKSAEDLGIVATREFYQKKIDQGYPYNVQWARKKLDELLAGDGETLFRIIVDIIEDHPRIQLILK